MCAETAFSLEGAIVDPWHADALDDYSGGGGYQDQTFLRASRTRTPTAWPRLRLLIPAGIQGGQSDGQTLMAVSETNAGYEATFSIALYVD